MLRKSLGVFTAVLAALLLVGVAWASGNAVQDVSGSGSQGTPPSSNVSSSSGSLVTESTGTSLDPARRAAAWMTTRPPASAWLTRRRRARPSTRQAARALTTDPPPAPPCPRVRPARLSTTDNREETRTPAPVNSGPTTYQVGTAGTVTVQVTGGQLVLIDAIAATGWNLELDRADGREVKVEFESGGSDAKFEAKVDSGELRVRVEPN